MINRLDDVQARELIARLCRAELRTKGYSEDSVTWGGHQLANDGGVDVRVKLPDEETIDGFVQAGQCIFQVKAEKNFKGKKIANEMAPKGVFRDSIAQMAECQGAYIIASTKDNHSDLSLEKCKQEMAACLEEYRINANIVLDYYDSRRLADWVEQHPVVAIWIRDVLGEPLEGWQPYAPWAYQEIDIEQEYLLDERVKIFFPNNDEGRDVQQAIESLRSDLSRNVAVRLVGLSGVGKTRLVQALFDERITTAATPLGKENVIYTDLSDNPVPQPNGMLEALISVGSDCVVVVDNCGQEIHQKLCETVKRKGSQLRLITIEYDIRDHIPEGTVCYRLEGSSDELIKELLVRRFDILSEADIDKIVEFSEGNSRVAFALADSTDQQNELARLRDDELFRRLFEQKHRGNNELLKCAEIASLLYSFDGEDVSPQSEIALLSSLAEVSVLCFSRHVTELKRRGLIQQRGKWRALLPHAISNRLAIRALEAIPNDLLIGALVEKGSDRVAKSFARRLGYLHEYEHAEALAKKWMEPSGRLGDLTKLNEVEREMFFNIAPLHQPTTLQALDRATGDPEFISTKNYDRADFARILRSLAYDADHFEKAVEILLRFTLNECDDRFYLSTDDILKSLFFSHFSGTHASPVQRAAMIKSLLFSSNEKRQEVGLALLSAALKSESFSSSFRFDFGARRRDFGWRPQAQEDVKVWYSLFISIAVEIGQEKSHRGQVARRILGSELANLWVYAGMKEAISDLCEVLRKVDGWPEGWIGFKRIIRWKKEKLSDSSLKQVELLEKFLVPSDLRAKINARVRSLDSFEIQQDENVPGSVHHKKAGQESIILGQALAHDIELIANILPDLFLPDRKQFVWHIGYGAGLEIKDAALILDQARDLLESTNPSETTIVFLRGFLSAWYQMCPNEVNAFLDSILDDDVWSLWFPELQHSVGIDELGYQRLIKSLENNKVPVFQYGYLILGKATDPLNCEQIGNLISLIKEKGDDGLHVAIDLLGMVVSLAQSKDDDYRKELQDLCLAFLLDLDWVRFRSLSNLDHDMPEILEFALSTSKFDNQISTVLNNLISQTGESARFFERDISKLICPFMKYHPTETLDAIYIADDDDSYRDAVQRVGDPDSEHDKCAVAEIKDDVLIQWCDVSPDDRYVFAARTCDLFKRTSAGEQFTDLAVRIFSNAPDKLRVLDIFTDRFRPRGWVGSLAAIYRQRLLLLKTLKSTVDESLGSIVDQAEKCLVEIIRQQEEKEVRQEKREAERFE